MRRKVGFLLRIAVGLEISRVLCQLLVAGCRWSVLVQKSHFVEVVLAVVLNGRQVQRHTMLALGHLEQVDGISRLLMVWCQLIVAAKSGRLRAVCRHAAAELRIHKATAQGESTGLAVRGVFLLSGQLILAANG